MRLLTILEVLSGLLLDHAQTGTYATTSGGKLSVSRSAIPSGRAVSVFIVGAGQGCSRQLSPNDVPSPVAQELITASV
jgi:hypothetical protein